VLAVNVEVTDQQPAADIVAEYAQFAVDANLTEYGPADAPVFRVVGAESDLRLALALVFGMQPKDVIDECIASAEVA
jgi:hypothetical protein